MKMDQLATVLGKITEECRENTILKMIELLETGVVNLNTSVYEWTKMMGSEHIPTPSLANLVQSWQSSSATNESVAFGLRTALKTKQRVIRHTPDIELVWTGPHPPSSSQVRDTFSVMLEMMYSAHKSILLVGYSLTSSTAFPAAVLEQLVAAKKRGCDLKIALHDDGKNQRILKKIWPSNVGLPILLKWTGHPEDAMASLHAKLLLADRRDLLVTSANLTHHGLSTNIEVGIRVKGSIANRMADHFNSLERAGILQRIEGGDCE
ncbi:phospholipase D-like domain-containing protein [Paenibacillus sp. 32352]|uniref:phospholipase D-like domain-containing protein n=1 Tax=Paenibacillus sp. 32352 TaxID=1969111 RepID=UPI0009AC6EEA|nr:phospholipase D-like domain-containing protein [Paenibacillus sp. 32352]